MRLLLPISSIHEFPSRSIDFVLAFTQVDLGVDVFMELSLVMLVDGNRIEWFLKLKNECMVSSKQVQIGLII